MRLLQSPPKEADHQKRAVEYVRARGYERYLVMIPNGTQLPGGPKQRARYMASLKAMGLRVGASDLLFAYPVQRKQSAPRGWYHGAWFEMKRSQNIGASLDQLSFLTDMERVGYYVCVCGSFDAFRHHFENYLLGAAFVGYEG